MSMLVRQVTTRFAALNISSRNGVKKALVPVLFMQHNMASQAQSHVGKVPSHPAIKAVKGPPVQEININKNLDFYKSPSTPKNSSQRPLAIILNWMLAKKRHVMKFGNFYLDQGMDVLSVTISPLQLLWPNTGAQVLAETVLKFANDSPEYKSILIHGFSVGGYLYGEMLVKIVDNPQLYGGVADRIVGQVFDSAVDYQGIPNGLSKAVTNNRHIQKWLQMYISYHMRVFYDTSTKYYHRSSEVFHNNPVRTPSLFYFSRDDPVGTEEGNMKVIRNWEKNGVKVFVKCFDSSPHVGHLHYHPKEYMDELATYMDRIDMLAVPLESVKHASKL